MKCNNEAKQNKTKQITTTRTIKEEEIEYDANNKYKKINICETNLLGCVGCDSKLLRREMNRIGNENAKKTSSVTSTQLKFIVYI